MKVIPLSYSALQDLLKVKGMESELINGKYSHDGIIIVFSRLFAITNLHSSALREFSFHRHISVFSREKESKEKDVPPCPSFLPVNE